MYVCVRESVFACSSVHACVYMCGCMVMYLVCILQNCVNAQALHIESSFEHTLNSRMKTLLHLHPHSGCSTAERENCVSF